MIGELSPLGEIVTLSFKMIIYCVDFARERAFVFFGDVCNYVELGVFGLKQKSDETGLCLKNGDGLLHGKNAAT